MTELSQVGLTVRWSLREAERPVDEVAAELESYVAQTSYPKFSGQAGLRFKTWRTKPGEWFEGTYVFASAQARADFQEAFAQAADDAPISQMLGSGPELIEEFRVVAVAEGWEGFEASPHFDTVSDARTS